MGCGRGLLVGCGLGAMGCGKGVLQKIEKCFLNFESQNRRFRTANNIVVVLFSGSDLYTTKYPTVIGPGQPPR